MASIKGFAELLPEQEIVQQYIIRSISKTYESHGFAPLQTRSIEHLDTLLNQGETDKEIYGVHRLAASSEVDFKWGLHYDLTVPFARYVADNKGKLQFPFRRYQIQQAWRGERPQKGRYREFIQADADIVDEGELDLRHDAELLLLLHQVTAALPIPPITLYVNNRKVLEGFYTGIGLPDITGALRAVDKLPKIGKDGVAEILVSMGVSSSQAEACIALSAIEATSSDGLKEIHDLGVKNELLAEGLDELGSVLDTVGASSSSGSVVAGLHIARGLDYYTGTVVEGVFADHANLGSVCSGGRYDNLVSNSSTPVPGVGVSIGISRLMAYCFDLGVFETSRRSPAEVLVIVHSEQERSVSNHRAELLRERGISVLVSDSSKAYGKQIKGAEKLGIKYVWFPNSDGDDDVKQIETGEQHKANVADWLPERNGDWGIL